MDDGQPAAPAAYMPLDEVLKRAAFSCLGAFLTPEAKSNVGHAQHRKATEWLRPIRKTPGAEAPPRRPRCTDLGL